MSIDMTPRAIEYKVKAGRRATLELTISDSTGSAIQEVDTVEDIEDAAAEEELDDIENVLSDW